MKTGRLALVAVSIFLAAVASPRAEIGIGGSTGTGSNELNTNWLVLGDTTEDPSPIPPTFWRKYYPNSAGRYALNEGGEANGDGAPSLIADPSRGVVIAAWAMNSPSGFDVVVSRFTGGAWTAPQVVAGTPANELDPQLVLADDGVVHLVYWSDDGATRRVLHTQSPDLVAWSAPDAVSGSGEYACRPAAVMHLGTLRVAYEVHNFGFGGTPRQVVLARRDVDGFVPEVVAVTSNSGDVVPQVHSHAGRIWVDWIDGQNPATGAGEVAWTRLDPQGGWETIRYEPFTGYEQREYFVRGTVRGKATAP